MSRHIQKELCSDRSATRASSRVQHRNTFSGSTHTARMSGGERARRRACTAASVHGGGRARCHRVAAGASTDVTALT
ncbi:hypothetical protein EYF80_050357 [Liparis tanakae]|uniref:Uncharacterized protein n=1 Tax=Liparis tanakae TaxID=230148 RepID=A0A4Z2FF08_9TELE|nr:hypothetical protein EYF80_050357 [Liparis tanakae]